MITLKGLNHGGKALIIMKNTLIAIGAAHALYLMVLVLIKKNKQGPDYLLTAYFAVFFVTLATAFGAFAYQLEALLVFHLNISLLLAPLFFVYITALTQSSRPPPARLGHFVPYLLTWLYWLYLFTALSEQELDSLFAQTDESQLPVGFALALLVESLAIPVYVIWALWLLERHRRTIRHTFSFTEGVDLKWARVLAYGTGILWLGVVVSEALGSGVKLNSADEDIQNGYALSTFFLYYLGYFGLKQGRLYTDALPAPSQDQPALPEAAPPAAKYSRSGLKAEEGAAYAERVIDYLKTEKPYLRSRLSIQDLAGALDIPAHALSQVINEHLNASFYDLINRHRVDEFKKRVADPQYQHFTLIAIALDCGFNSKSSFNRIFKKYEQRTPTEYVKSHPIECVLKRPK